jgi:hypothetical protein
VAILSIPRHLKFYYELGLFDEFLKLPHSIVRQIHSKIGDDRVVIGHVLNGKLMRHIGPLLKGSPAVVYRSGMGRNISFTVCLRIAPVWATGPRPLVACRVLAKCRN